MGASDEDLDAIRKRKLQELQEHASSAEGERQMQQQRDAMKKAILRQILTPEARERLTRLSMAYPDVADNVEQQLVALYQTGRVRGKLDDATFKRILAQIVPKKKDITIERR